MAGWYPGSRFSGLGNIQDLSQTVLGPAGSEPREVLAQDQLRGVALVGPSTIRTFPFELYNTAHVNTTPRLTYTAGTQ